MNSKLIGGILLILGTSIGAGLLALPIACSQNNFITSVALLFASWLTMTFGAFLILEVNLWLPENSNLISMAKLTLGRFGQITTWFIYLFLLYALMCAYISGSGDILHSIFAAIHLPTPSWSDSILVVMLLGAIVYRGIYSVDIVNRGLMSSKIIIYIALIAIIMPHLQVTKLTTGSSPILISTIMVIITSFGYAIIIPSLRSYFNSDIKQLRKAIFFGSLVPLVFYILWIAVVQGTLPTNGTNSLRYMLNSGHATTELANSLSHHLNNIWITTLSHIFTSICAATSFLGVSLALTDFLADGFKINKKSKRALIIYLATFGPPLIIVLLSPGIFIRALGYAGIFCVALLMLLPAKMAWSGRYFKKIPSNYQVLGGKQLLLLQIAAAFLLIIWSLTTML